eukprot:362927-Chlamydomonas_euryale.AAC.8
MTQGDPKVVPSKTVAAVPSTRRVGRGAGRGPMDLHPALLTARPHAQSSDTAWHAPMPRQASPLLLALWPF